MVLVLTIPNHHREDAQQMDVTTILVTMRNPQLGKPYMVKLKCSKGLRDSLQQEGLNLNPENVKLDLTSAFYGPFPSALANLRES